jgi:hypothetical protein
MNCSEFRANHEKYTTFPQPPEVWDTVEFSDWNNHLHHCAQCSDWHLLGEVQKRGASVDDYPCVHMAYHATFTCEEHPNLYACSKAAILYSPRFDEYYIGPRGGTGDDILITRCPWCGVNLPESKRGLWFEKLEQMGIDPTGDDIPEEFYSGAWRKI